MLSILRDRNVKEVPMYMGCESENFRVTSQVVLSALFVLFYWLLNEQIFRVKVS